MIKLYHGSNMKVLIPDLLHSKPFKDFGRGFYLSADKQQALDMAFQKVKQTQTGKAEVSVFLFDETIMNSGDLRILNFPDYCEEWALFVLNLNSAALQFNFIYKYLSNKKLLRIWSCQIFHLP